MYKDIKVTNVSLGENEPGGKMRRFLNFSQFFWCLHFRSGVPNSALFAAM